MLAQNFKTATDLGLSDRGFEGLVRVLGMLERGELHHVPVDGKYEDAGKVLATAPTNLFNMHQFFAKSSCGTAACIAGSSDWFFGTKFVAGETEWPDGLERLFFPDATEVGWSDITTAQAAIALRSYLTSGEPCWDEAVSV